MKKISIFLIANLISILAYCQYPATIIISSAEGKQGENKCVQVAFGNMYNLVGFSGTVTYDATTLKFDAIKILSESLPNGFISHSEHPLPDTTKRALGFSGIDIPAGRSFNLESIEPIMDICFDLIGETGSKSDIEFNGDLSPFDFVSQDEQFNLSDIEIKAYSGGEIRIVEEPNNDEFTIITYVENLICGATLGGLIQPISFFGSPPYSYSWTGENGFSSTEIILLNIEAGNYCITVTDASGNTEVLKDIIVDFDNLNEILVDSIIDATCGGSPNGSISISSVTALNVDVNYLWSNNAPTQNIQELDAGFYTVTATDTNGCIDSATFEVPDDTKLLDRFFLTNGIICDVGEGGVSALVKDDVMEPHSFLWSTGDTTQRIINLDTGFYSVIITDGLGCIDHDTFHLTSIEPLDEYHLETTCSTMGLDNGSIELVGDAFLFSTVFNMDWSTGESDTYLLENLAPGEYDITLSTSICERVISTVIEESLTDYIDDFSACNQDSFVITTNSNNPTLMYDWSPSFLFEYDSVPSPTYITANDILNEKEIILTTTGELGCKNKFIINNSSVNNCVWPGDTNLDASVSVDDLLNIGISNGESGPQRPDASSNWFAQTSIDWNREIGNTGIDMMHADCNGDGFINIDDILVVDQNLELTHDGLNSESEVVKMLAIPLFVDLNHSYTSGEENLIDIILGDEQNPGNDIYGLAFQLKFNPEFIKILAGETLENGWLSSDNSDLWMVDFSEPSLGILDIAITRTNGKSTDGFGKIAEFNSLFLSSSEKSDFKIEVINPILINNVGDRLEVEGLESSGSIFVSTSYLGSDMFNEKIFPNPAADYLSFISDRTITSFKIYDILGNLVSDNLVLKDKIQTSNLSSGLYTIIFNGVDGLTAHKFIKQ